jgi:hypothetical protein
MLEAVINGIFPTPIYMSKLDRKLTPLELKFVDKSKKIFIKMLVTLLLIIIIFLMKNHLLTLKKN